MKNIFRSLIIVIALLLTLDVYAGGGNRTGTGGAAQLLIPVGPRGIAMGEANLAVGHGIESIFFYQCNVFTYVVYCRYRSGIRCSFNKL
mgnify:CR=1 FL=1